MRLIDNVIRVDAMEQFLIVDGYNIIGAWPELQSLKDSELEGARNKLIHELSEYQSFSGLKVYVVFDAYKVPGLGKKYLENKLRIVYTKEKQTADELIEKLVTQLIGRGKRIYVATSDMIEQHVIFGMGAYRITANELREKIYQNKKDVRHRIEEERHTKRNSFDNNLNEVVKEALEKWRRGI
jgi:predicted RNA-binding protein with PIN domain